jgi:hypothetical protein
LDSVRGEVFQRVLSCLEVDVIHGFSDDLSPPS